ncbi:DUF2007 domain-containing protein [Vibrio tubiashii]|uniref:DUF2007 domain-containing protein n=1 Tax=Vibrio tubiashii TaxID=29498 RepID=A0AAE5GRD5_9VIBR|nr:DUF2007 domain-containing protein [Vibrio tubiashii]NOI81586.1 DUF2007 domain-containing protein [Vibrio tubiashii]
MRIYSASNPTEAHIVCELLKSQQIECEVRGEGVFGLQGEIPFGESSEPYVWLLDPEQAKHANAVIEQFNNADVGSNWLCNQCGEMNEPQFGACWQCGQAAP